MDRKLLILKTNLNLVYFLNTFNSSVQVLKLNVLSLKFNIDSIADDLLYTNQKINHVF